MGGRIYAPNSGRFLQADPFVQAPGNSQSPNRYSYVFNNPMAYTDPTGYWGAKEQAGLRTVAAIVIACVTGYYAGAAISAGGAGAVGNAAAISFAGGFAAGAVQSGTLRGAAIGGISSLAFFGVAQAFPVKGMNIASGEGMAAYSKLALASGITGGVMAELQGGRFGNGFVTAGANAYLAPIPEAASSNAGTQTVIAAVIGGTVSRVTGGKFANGAVTGAFQFAVGRAVASSSGQKKRGAFDYTDAELQGFVDASPKFGMDLSLNDDFLNSSKGIGDSLSFGSTRAIREWIDGAPDSAVDTDSYKIGYYGVMVPSLVRLGYSATIKATAEVGYAIGGIEGARFANGARNFMRIAARLFTSGYGQYSFPSVSAKYGGNANAIIAASARSNPYYNQLGIVGGGAQATSQAAACVAGQSGC